jgi:hydrogenase maturation protease
MPESARRNILVIGYGNPGRLDDGLGPAFAQALQELNVPGITVESDYQLTVEYAALAARHDMVVFVDASVSGKEPFEWTSADEDGDASFSTHSVQPGELVALTRTLFHAKPAAYVLAIRGYKFNDFGEGLSVKARRNMTSALAFFRTKVAAGPESAGCRAKGSPSWN